MAASAIHVIGITFKLYGIQAGNAAYTAPGSIDGIGAAATSAGCIVKSFFCYGVGIFLGDLLNRSPARVASAMN